MALDLSFPLIPTVHNFSFNFLLWMLLSNSTQTRIPVMHTLSVQNIVLSYLVTLSPVFAQLLPDSKALVLNELEHIYLDDSGPNSITSTIITCSTYVYSTTGGLTNNSLGRQTAAQLMRTAFRKAKLLYLPL